MGDSSRSLRYALCGLRRRAGNSANATSSGTPATILVLRTSSPAVITLWNVRTPIACGNGSSVTRIRNARRPATFHRMAPNPPADYEHLYEDPAIYARRWFLLAMMCTSLVLVVMSVSGMNVALPSLQRDLHAKATDLQWIVDSYSLVFAGLLLTAGAIGDRYGRRRALVGGLIVFAGGAAVGGFAKSAHVVIAGRSIMGIGAAFVMPATLSLGTNIFPPRERRRAIAIWAGFAGAGGAIGPLVSGALLNHFWWGAALLINVPVVAAILVCILTFAPTSRDPDLTPLDPVGAAL